MRGVLALSALVVLVGGSAGNGRILAQDAGGLFTIRPDGTGRIALSTDGRSSSGVVSPDGTRVAFLESDGGSPRDLYVANVDGAGGARLLASHPEVENAGGIHGITWSPDSARLAYFLTFANPAVRVVDAREGSPQALPQEGDARPFGTLAWSPDGSELLYDSDTGVWAKPLDGAPARRVVPSGTSPAWSPDGQRIAFDRGSDVYVVNRHGGGEGRIGGVPVGGAGPPRWLPEGARVVFGGLVSSKAGGKVAIEVPGVWIARVDRFEQTLLRENVLDPLPSPDGSRLLVRRYPGAPEVLAMNLDGGCLTHIAEGLALDWQRLPGGEPGAPHECVDLVVAAKGPPVAGLRGPSFSLDVQNEGTLTATAVRLVARLDADVQLLIGQSSQRFCSAAGAILTCVVDRMEPRQSLNVAVLARPEAAGPLTVTVTASSADADSDPVDNETSQRTRIYPCWIAGTDYADRLIGTNVGEQICARAGNDVVRGRGGNDVLDGGAGADTLDGGAGRDRIYGRHGDDTILVGDGQRDSVDCGWGDDVAVVDRVDRVAPNCEHVRRG